MVRRVTSNHVIYGPVATFQVFTTSCTYWLEDCLSVSSCLSPLFAIMPFSHAYSPHMMDNMVALLFHTCDSHMLVFHCNRIVYQSLGSPNPHSHGTRFSASTSIRSYTNPVSSHSSHASSCKSSQFWQKQLPG